MLFADVIDPEKLAQTGSPYVLSVAVVAVSAALVYVFKTWRGDVQTMQAKHDQEKKEQRTEYTDALDKVTLAVQAVAGEAEATSRAMEQLARESQANTAAVLNRLDRLESHLPQRP
jgi:uncharacterized membrane protein